MVDALRNFATSLITVAPSPALSGGSLTIMSGDAAGEFAAAPFYATCWPSGVVATKANAEIVRVTLVTIDTFNITRAQDNSIAQPIAIGWQIEQGVTVALLAQIMGLTTTETARALAAEAAETSRAEAAEASLASGPYDAMVASLNPSAWWKLNDGVGSTVAHDSSGHCLDGTVTGTVTFGQPGPITGTPANTSALFDGSTGQIISSFAAPHQSTTGLVWANITASGADKFLISAGDSSAGWSLYIDGVGDLHVVLTSVVDDNTSIQPSTGWHFFSIILDASGHPTVYVDGVDVYSIPASTSVAPTSSFFIGAQNSVLYAPGEISEVAVLPVALTAAQVLALYNAAPKFGEAHYPHVATDSLSVAGKNVIINGGFDICQRTNVFTPAVTSKTYTADRWFMLAGTASQYTAEQASGVSPPGFKYVLRFQRINGSISTAQSILGQGIESANVIPLQGKVVTLSFFARAGVNYSQALNVLSMGLYSGTGTDEDPSAGYTGQVTVATYNAKMTTSWQRFSFTGVVPVTATELRLLASYTPVGTAGAADYFDITGVQLELGPVATVFSRAGGDIQGELAKCQRYYYKANSANASDGYNIYGMGQCIATTNAVCYVFFPVTMRVAPSTFTSSAASQLAIDTANGTGTAVTAIGLNRATPNLADIAITVASGMVAGNATTLHSNANQTSYLAFSAEL
jgi:hypothetical protein